MQHIHTCLTQAAAEEFLGHSFVEEVKKLVDQPHHVENYETFFDELEEEEEDAEEDDSVIPMITKCFFVGVRGCPSKIFHLMLSSHWSDRGEGLHTHT